MANHGCINGSLDTVNYSGPVPVIGLYIAGASAACMLMMLWDIGAGYFARKRWLPCKVFKLDSVTLTLLGVVAKLPVDLTSEMPSRMDQLSKLTGTVIICISMGFLVPSLGISSESECFTNLVALTIFVIAVFVNISIQLHTGVIVLFFKEHIIILCLMLLLLVLLWHCSLIIKKSKSIVGDQYKDLLAKGNTSMFGRLKVCYLYSYCSNPQFNICKDPIYASVSLVCLMCSIVLMQATFRSVILKRLEFCSGDSDYGWSMPAIIITQILTVVVGTLAIVFRWLALFSRMEFEKIIVAFLNDEDVMQRNKTLGKQYRMRNWFVSLYMRFTSAGQLLIVGIAWVLRKSSCLYRQDRLEFFDKLPHEGVIAAGEYIVRKSVEDIIKFRKDCTKKSLRNLLRLLPAQPVHPRGNSYPDYLRRNELKVCSISVAILIKVAEVAIPNYQLGSIPSAFKEANEIIHFIDKTLQTSSSDSNDQISYAKAVWKDGDFSCLLPDEILGMDPGLNRAIAIINKLKEELQSEKLWRQLHVMVDFINTRSYSTIEELSSSIEQMFFDMLHAMFVQLPLAIYRSLRESPTAEFEERVRVAMDFLFKIEPTGVLEGVDRIAWSFPPDSNLSSFITDEAVDSHAVVYTGPLERLQEIVPQGDDLELMFGENGV